MTNYISTRQLNTVQPYTSYRLPEAITPSLLTQRKAARVARAGAEPATDVCISV